MPPTGYNVRAGSQELRRRATSANAARYLRSLATIEKLSALGQDDEVRRLLAGIDPEEALALAAELEGGDVIALFDRCVA